MEDKEAPGVKPIKSVSDLLKWEKYIAKHCSLKIHTYFVIGLDVGLNPTFLHSLKWEDIKYEHTDTTPPQNSVYLLVPSIIQDEPRKIIFSAKSVEMLKKLKEKYPEDIYLFQSESPNSKNRVKPITMHYLGIQLKESAEKSKIPLPGPVGGVTLRKSFGYHHVVHGTWSVHQLMRYFEQRSLNITRNYIGLTDEKVNAQRLPRKPRGE